MRATDGTVRFALLDSDERRQLAARIAVATVCVALAIALFLLTRRATGALSATLPVAQLVATAIIVTGWAVCVRELTSNRRSVLTLTIAAVALFAVACSYPGTRAVDWLAWGGALAAVAWLPSKRPGEAKSPLPQVSRATNREVDLESDSELVLQQLTRIRTDEGQDAIRGTLLGEFAAGERQITLHTSFCPPFEQLPEVEVNIADDSDATVKLSQVLHNGVQLEVKLASPAAEATTVAIEFFATDSEQI